MARADVLSFEPWPGFRLGHLGLDDHGITLGRVGRRSTDDVLIDTADLRISRSGVTITWSASGDMPTWTLHLGRRVALSMPGSLDDPPERVTAAVVALRRGEALRPVARVRRTVVTTPLLQTDAERDDAVLGEIGTITEIDRSVLDGTRIVARSRRMEVAAPAGILDALSSTLRVEVVRGRRRRSSDVIQELRRAAGPLAFDPPEPVPPPLDEASTVADVVRATLARAVNRWLAADPVVRLDVDIEGVHQARVGMRTLRSDLRTFRDFLDDSALTDFADEVRWAAQALGAVRDLDVLRERLVASIADLDEADRVTAESLVGALDEERADALRALHDALDSPRYLQLVEQAVSLAADPPLRPEADEAAADALTRAALRSWRRLARSADAARPRGDVPIEELHATRIRAKRFRYAAEAAGEVLPGALAHAKRVAAVQSVLGDLHDAAVLEQWLRDKHTAGAHDPFVVGQLVMYERAAIAEIRREWLQVWERARRRRGRRWLKRD